MVERPILERCLTHLADAQKDAIKASNCFTAERTPMRYIRMPFVTGEDRVMCLFDPGRKPSSE